MINITEIKNKQPVVNCIEHNYVWLGYIKTCTKCGARLSAKNSPRSKQVRQTETLAQKTSNDVDNKNNTLKTEV